MGAITGPAMSFPGPTSQTWTTPYPATLGTIAIDGPGNVYVLCQTGSNTTVAPEMAVTIAASWIVTPVGTTANAGRGPVGVVADLGKSSASAAPSAAFAASTAIWVQVYGRAFVQVGANASSPSDAANGPTTVQTSLQTQFFVPTSVVTPVGVLGLTSDASSLDTRLIIRGITVADDVSLGDVSTITLVSATHIGARVAVMLNFPEIGPYTGIAFVS